jgi:sensor histidine kinase regulating citrate/malate metabolism
LEGRELTEEAVGTLGSSLRSVVPVTSDGKVVALVSAGITLGSVGAGVLRQVPFVVAIAIALAAIGLAAAWFAGRFTRRIAGDLPASAVRDAVSSYESVRTLGEALRAQTHEHGNRMHTAVALMELGRTDEAIELLTETARSSQELVDKVVARDGDPTVAALLLGKAAQAAERGVEWSVDMQPAIPRTSLGAVDAVSLVGNLIDNAIDAAASGPEPRWVRVGMVAASDGRIVLTFSDSGAGVADADRERIFEHGFSTKPAGADGRGVGLALVRAITDAAGGTLELTSDPTTFRVVLPAQAVPT